MANLKHLVSKVLFNDAPIIDVDRSLKSVNDTLFVYSETKPTKGSNHFFGLNIQKLRRSKFAVLVLGNDLVCLKIPSQFLFNLPLYKDGNRFLIDIQFNEDTHEYELFHKKDKFNKTIVNCTQFQHSLSSPKQVVATAVGLKHILYQ